MNIPVAIESEGSAVPVETATDLQVRYDRAIAVVMRMGNWLSSPQAQLLAAPDWEEHFARYQEQLDALRVLGDQLRPVAVRRPEPLNGDVLTRQVLDLFADEGAKR